MLKPIPKNAKDWPTSKPFVALQQSFEYARTLNNLGIQNRLALFENNTYAHLIIRRFLWLKGHAILRGPIGKNIDIQTLKSLRKELGIFSPLIVSPIESLNHKRVMTGDSTVWIDLVHPKDTLRQNLDKKWRNALKKAESDTIQIRQNEKEDALAALCTKEHNQEKQRGYFRALPKNFEAVYRNLNGKKSLLHIQAVHNRYTIAEMLFFIHGVNATYHIGWSNEVGRQKNAHNLLMWHAMTVLKSRKIKALDLAGIDTVHNAGIARFKIGTGGHVQTYPGSYLF